MSDQDVVLLIFLILIFTIFLVVQALDQTP